MSKASINMSKRIALFDMDIIAYRAAAVVEKRTIEVEHIASGKSKPFDNRTAFKTFLKKQGKEYAPEAYNIKEVQNAQPVSHALQIVKSQVNKIKDQVNAEDVYGFIGKGSTNFRLNLELPKLYKGQREEMIRPIHLDATKQYVVDNYIGGYIDGIEVDDEVTIRYHELEEAGHDPVIISLDKDCKSQVGTKFYDWTQDEPKIVEVPAWGHLEYIYGKDVGKKSDKVDGLGLNFFCYQLLYGDDVDNFHVGDLAQARFGAKSVVDYLNQAKCVDDLFALTEAKYKEWFRDSFEYITHDGKTVKKSYKEILDMYCRCAYMKRSRNDKTDFYSLWKEFT